ncbi:MAG TPA: UDP-N-acetylmuramoyl-L-alanyl-D-glutamate--2,6-diaminopimelate ligase [Acidimicrobiales bacterium]|nr:UDP-N-acetylmuramoyl-L-alanyl-D-glutamate--2,6-diaminopimelate ligase [Acidimicrobiales bacterium]
MSNLDDLLGDVEVRAILGAPVEVTSVTHDSRKVRVGSLFCCVPGAVTDGHVFAADAVALGASSLLVERRLDLDVTQVVVDDVRRAMGPLAASFHGHPSDAMDVVGVTGTNGKTTTVWLLRSIFEQAGRMTGMIGTLTGARTTPESTDLQTELAVLRDGGATAVAMEVSSHALAQSRVAGTHFKVGVFTNLSRDHLEYHDTMEDYFAAKALLFEPGQSDVGVVNADDPRGQLLLDAARIPTRAFSLSDVDDLRVLEDRSEATWRGHRLVVPLGAVFNVSNALAAATAALELGIPEEDIVAGIAAAPQAPGRFELVDAGQPFAVVVDFAHTPDGIENLLRAARQVAGDGQLTIVFGAGGDKDRGKRPMMGDVASRLADVVVLTSDNPRSEDPMSIIEEIRAGATGSAYVITEPDRRAAIELALKRATAGDVVVVAGKGHETTQTVGDTVLPFDDRVVVREVLA